MDGNERVESRAAPGLVQLSAGQWHEFRQIVARFEEAWKRNGRPDVAEFLPGADPLRLAVLLELVHVDFEHRCRSGTQPDVAEYVARFPELAAHERLAPSLIAAKDRLQQSGSRANTVVERHPTMQMNDCRHSTAGSRPGHMPPDEAETSEHGTSEAGTSAADHPVLAGPAFEDRYEILGEIGRGGMGVVYRVHDRRRNEIVALKTLQWIDPGMLYRFKQEFRILADVAHPNLVTLYELFSDGRRWCFTMEYVVGQDFLTFVTTPAAAFDRLRQTLQQLVAALSFLHNAGKLHRDIKPQNILVTPQNRLVLLDFGLMAEMEHEGRHESTVHNVVGTCAYMSPEQAAALPVSAASDWYSVGVMLFQALTGRLPFEGGFQAVLRDKQTREVVPPRELAPLVPDDLNDLCVGLLKREPAERPAAEDILYALRGSSVSPIGSTAWPDTEPNTAPVHATAPAKQPALLVGRKQHLGALANAFRAVTEGQTVTIYVQGRSGSGKTALVQGFLDQLSPARPPVVLRGKCYEQESMPYKALDSIIDALARHLGHLPGLEVEALLPRDIVPLARLFPVLRRVETVARMQRSTGTLDPHELRRRAVAGLRDLLGRIGDRQPLVIVIDDLQWGDADSAAVLADLLRPPDPPVLLFVACLRREDLERGPLKQALEQFHQQIAGAVVVQTVEVEPLSAQESRELALALLGPTAEELLENADTIARESGGNPFFLHELARQVASQGEAPAPTQGKRAVALDELIFWRAQSLPENARRLLEVVAVAGRPLAQPEAFQAAELARDHAGVLALLRSEHLLRTTGAGDDTFLETYHDRVREAIATRLPHDALVRHHRQLAVTLQRSSHADPEEVAVHFQAAGESGKAATHFEIAADQAAHALAFQRAARLYETALGLGAREDQARRTLQVKLAQSLADAGRGIEAARAFLTAAENALEPEGTTLRRKAAMQLLINGRVAEGTALLRAALQALHVWFPKTTGLALVGLLGNRLRQTFRGLQFQSRPESELPPEPLLRLDCCWNAVVGFSHVDFIRSAYFQSKCMLLALETGEPQRVMRSIALEICHRAAAGSSARAQIDKLTAAGERLSQKLGDPYAAAYLEMARGVSDALCGRWHSAHEACDRSTALFRTACTGVNWELDSCHRYAAWTLAYRGQMVELNRRLPALLQEARERGNLYVETSFGTFVIPGMRLAADDPAGARAELHGSVSRCPQQGYHVQHLMQQHDDAVIDIYEGHGLSALQRLRATWPAFVKSHLVRVAQLRILLVDARARSALSAATAASEPGEFLQSASADAKRLSRERDAWARALANLIRAGLCAFRGYSDESIALLRQAIRNFDELEMPLHAAAARLRLAALVGGDEARDERDLAMTWMNSQEIRNAPRLAALLAPGFRDA